MTRHYYYYNFLIEDNAENKKFCITGYAFDKSVVINGNLQKNKSLKNN